MSSFVSQEEIAILQLAAAFLTAAATAVYVVLTYRLLRETARQAAAATHAHVDVRWTTPGTNGAAHLALLNAGAVTILDLEVRLIALRGGSVVDRLGHRVASVLVGEAVYLLVPTEFDRFSGEDPAGLITRFDQLILDVTHESLGYRVRRRFSYWAAAIPFTHAEPSPSERVVVMTPFGTTDGE